MHRAGRRRRDRWRQKVPLREGSTPIFGERHVAVLGDTAAASLGKKLGDEMELSGQSFRIVGIANYTTIVNRGLVLVPLRDLQKATYRQRQVTVAHVNVEHASGRAELDRVRSDIQTLGVTVSTANDVLDNDRNFAILEAISLSIAVIGVAMSALNVLNALVMATQERTREIGILAATGWSNGQLMTSIVVEGIVMYVIGCVLGVLLSFLAALAFPHIPAIGNLLSFKPSGCLIAPVLAAAFVLCILGSLFPAWRAVRMVPAEALRRI
jgi:putative ABC transport system permease protein